MLPFIGIVNLVPRVVLGMIESEAFTQHRLEVSILSILTMSVVGFTRPNIELMVQIVHLKASLVAKIHSRVWH